MRVPRLRRSVAQDRPGAHRSDDRKSFLINPHLGPEGEVNRARFESRPYPFFLSFTEGEAPGLDSSSVMALIDSQCPESFLQNQFQCA